MIDSFNRANEGPPPSASWSNGIITFIGGEGVRVLSNQATRAASGGYRQGSYYNASTYGPDCEVWFKVITTPATGDGFSVYLRLTTVGSGTTDGYAVDISAEDGTASWTPWRIDNGGVGFSGTTVKRPVASGSYIGLRMVGSTLSAWYKGSDSAAWQKITEMTDTTYTAAGNLGIEINGTSGVIDDFSGGTVSPTTDLINAYTSPQVSDVGGDDGDYFIKYGSEYILDQWKYDHVNNSDKFKVTWRGRSTVASTASPIRLQVYNNSSASWETIASETRVAADVDFQLQAVVNSPTNYYDSSNIIAARVYQLVV